MKVEVSNGEIVDKLTIIEIKLNMINDVEKRKNLLAEYDELNEATLQFFSKSHPLYQALLAVNTKLWHIEDACRDHEAKKLFNDDFIQVCRSVYVTNDERAKLKKEINLLTDSQLVEEKSYTAF